MSIPEKIGPYEIVSQIGSGGMATVYKAYQPRLDRYVAVKVMHKTFSEDPNFRARFDREARIVAKLDHPNIVPIYDYDEREGAIYLVMKCVEGVTLKTLLRKATLSPEEVLQLLTPVAEALKYAHNQGVLHRDIKPSNIIIDKQSMPYLTDFGLARIAQQGESTMSADMMLGTPHYISPEQAKGETNLDARTDVYSLGVVLYELIVGRVPFVGETSYAIIHDHIYTPPPPPSEIDPDISPEIEAVLLKALAKDRNARYATPTALIDAYRQAIGGKAPLAPEASAIAERPAAQPEIGASDVPQGFMARITKGLETFGEEMDAGFRDFDRDEYGRRLSDEEIKAKAKKEAKVIVKQSVQKAWRASGFSANVQLAGEVKGETEEMDKDYDGPLSEEERLRRRVEERIKKQRQEFQGVIVHIMAFIIINSWLFGFDDWMSSLIRGQNPGWPSIITLLWGLGLFAHLSDYWYDYGPGRRRRERLIEREMERERRMLYGSMGIEKAKHEDFEDHNVRLTEDGELTESFIEEQEDYRKRRNQ